MRMRKGIIIALLLLLAMMLSSCGGKDPSKINIVGNETNAAEYEEQLTSVLTKKFDNFQYVRILTIDGESKATIAVSFSATMDDDSFKNLAFSVWEIIARDIDLNDSVSLMICSEDSSQFVRSVPRDNCFLMHDFKTYRMDAELGSMVEVES